MIKKLLITAMVFSIVWMAPVKADSDRRFDLIDRVIEAEVYYGLSGAQIVIIHKGEVVKDSVYGFTNSYETIYENGQVVLNSSNVIKRDERSPVTKDTVFDLASNTKMYAGNYAVQYLITKGLLSLETRVVDVFPEYRYQGIGFDGQDDLTVGHLLRHDSGFIASPKYHDNTFTGNLGNGVSLENYLYTQDSEEILSKLLLTPLEYEPGTKVRYSDVDFMLIGKIVEAITGEGFDEFLSSHIYLPLGLSKIMFNPLEHGIDQCDIASTELHGNTRDGRVFFNNYRDTVISGEVHDEKAFYSFDGVAGHAGLFGNASDVASLALLMLEGGVRDGVEYFSKETIATFSQPSSLNDTYAYGWRRQGDDLGYGWAFSPFASSDTLGHTGWTGTITQIDPVNELVIVLLTNARNSPIMGPDKNDFYTKAFLTNDYGTITSLAYEGLGLGSNVSSLEFLKSLINTEIASGKDSASNRNKLRALLMIVKDLSIEDIGAREYLIDEGPSILNDLNASYLADTRHLDVDVVDKTSLERELNRVRSLNFSESAELMALGDLIFQDQSASQNIIDYIVNQLSGFDEVLDQTKLVNLIALISGLDRTIYTESSYQLLWETYEKANMLLLSDDLTQATIDTMYHDLLKLFNNLMIRSSTGVDSLPATGVSSQLFIYTGVAFALLGFGFLKFETKFRKKKCKR